MGAVYDIYLELNGVEDEDAIVKKTRDFIDQSEKVTWNAVARNLTEKSTLMEALRAIFGESITSAYDVKQREDGSYYAEPTPNGFDASFTASYGWLDVMYDWFVYISDVIGVDSSLTIDPDCDALKLINIGNGRVTEMSSLPERLP